MPVYNEIRTLEAALEAVLAAPVPCDREVVIVDDGSTDGSREFLQAFGDAHPDVRVILHEKNLGKGSAIRTAIQHMTGDWAVIQDADLEYDPSDYATLLKPAQMGIADAVFGSRFLTAEYRRVLLFWHTVANKWLTLVSNMLSGVNLTDMETCYKLVRADVLKSLRLTAERFEIEPELTMRLAQWDARIYEVPVSYRGRTYAEGKKIGTKDALAAFIALLKYRFFDKEFTTDTGFLTLRNLEKARRFNRWLFGQFSGYLGDEVLEVGCGIGNLTRMVLDKKRLVCVDISPTYVERIRRAYGHLANLSAYRADLASGDDLRAAAVDGPFDSAFCINVLEHIEDDVAAVKNLAAVLKPGGRLVVLVPHNPAIYSKLDELLGHYRRYTRESLAAAMEAGGLKVVKLWGFNRVGGMGWRVSGKWLRNENLKPNQLRLFELGMPVIRLAECLPVHSHNSLIVVAEKATA